jgi:hypothetical protein
MDAIVSARAMVLIFSAHTERSDHVKREVREAFDNSITVIPLRISQVRPSGTLGYYLRAVQLLDAYSGRIEDHLRSIAVTVRDIVYANSSGVTSGGIMRVFRDAQRALFVSLRSPLERTGLSLSLTLNFGCTKGLLGPSSNPSDQRGFHNCPLRSPICASEPVKSPGATNPTNPTNTSKPTRN